MAGINRMKPKKLKFRKVGKGPFSNWIAIGNRGRYVIAPGVTMFHGEDCFWLMAKEHYIGKECSEYRLTLKGAKELAHFYEFMGF